MSAAQAFWTRYPWLRRLLRLPAPAAPAGVPSVEAAADLADAPLDVLAAKVMYGHLRNRQQLLGPPPTALGHLDEGQTELLIRAAIAAAQANGHFGEAEERRLRGTLSSFGLQADERGFIASALKKPASLEALLRDARDPHLASLFYAASLLAADKHDEVTRNYLRYIATRLKLPTDALARLHSQFGFDAER